MATFTGVPTGLSATMSIRSWPFCIGLPLISVMMSSGFRPAFSAGPSGSIVLTNMPCFGAVNLQQIGDVFTRIEVIPIEPRVTWPS